MATRNQRGRLALVVTAIALLTLGFASPASAQEVEPVDEPDRLDHVLCYETIPLTLDPFLTPPSQVRLRDQFGTSTYQIGRISRLCNPTLKVRFDIDEQTEPKNPEAHLVCWKVSTQEFDRVRVEVTNQFGTARLDVNRPRELCLPSWKFHDDTRFPDKTEPPGLDHFLCYDARYTLDADFQSVDPFGSQPANVFLRDQFGGQMATIGGATTLCNPASKQRFDVPEITEITNPQAHLVCFREDDDVQYPLRARAKNQFGQGVLVGTSVVPDDVPAFDASELCLPSFKKVVK